MASSSVIGALRVVLGIDTASYEAGLTKAEKEAKKQAEKINSAISKITLAAGTALTGFGVAIVASIQKMDALGKASEKAGIPIEEFSVIASTAKKAGVDLESLTSAVGKLSKSMSQAGSGKLAGQASLAFEALGVKATEAGGKLRDTSAVIEQLADKFAGFKDGPEKTALAIALFGKAGAEMIPFLNKGGAAIRKQREEMEALGLVMDENTKNKARQFTESWSKLTNVWDSVFQKLAIELLPSITLVTKALADISKDAKTTATQGSFLGDVFVFVAREATLFSLSIRQVWQDIVGLAEAVKLSSGFVAGFGEILAGIATRSFALIRDGVKRMQAGWDDAGKAQAKYNDVVAKSAEEFARIKALVDAAFGTDSKKKVDDFGVALTLIDEKAEELGKRINEALKVDAPKIPTESIQKAIDDTVFKTRVLDQEFRKLPAGFAEAMRGLDPLMKLPTTMEGLTGKTKELAVAMLDFRGAQLTQENLLPWDLLNQKVAEYDLLLKNNVITTDVHRRATQKAADAAGMSWQSASKSISDSFTEAAGAFGDSQSKIVQTAKVLHAAQALIATYAGAAEALAGPFPANLVAAASVLAKGLVLVASIKGVGVGFKEGGSFKVGGAGGADSQLIQFMATPGEMVDVKTPAQQSGSNASESNIGAVQTIMLQARRMTDMMTLDDLRTLTERLNSANRDGYKLKFAS